MSTAFAERLLQWFDRHGRHDLPWQHPRDPYRVWLAEIMLQQTQVATVTPFFMRFIARFADVHALAQATSDDVLALWAGLGYYARARNLHRSAQIIVERHHGKFPQDIETLLDLPGIGRSTAGAILAQAFGQRHAILDGNVRRVLARHAAVGGWPGEPAVQKKLWRISERLLPSARLADYTQAIMDLGATVCTARKPACGICPLSDDCQAYQRGKTLDYPAPRPRRERPHKRAWLLLIVDADGHVLCERRPPAGIWGGLWCPPLVESEQAWNEFCQRHYQLAVGSAQPLPVIRHGFTHFDLDLLPLRLSVQKDTPDGAAETAPRRWLKMGQQAEAGTGLPAPVRKLLESPNLSLDQLQCHEPSTA
jgi:A/G-specific adenine glycosylase